MLDEKDIAILRVLRKNARTTYTEIAKQTGFTTPTVTSRLARLNLQFTSILDFAKIGYPIRFWVMCEEKDYQKLEEAASTAYKLNDGRIMAECLFESNSKAYEVLENINCEKIQVVEDVAKERFLTIP
ncbi:MAG: AsnC family transcriptional regulator [Candidatus Woesearchaeota archaeon]